MSKEITSLKLSFRNSIVSDFKEEAVKDVGYVPIGNKEAVQALVEDNPVYEFINVVHLGADYPAHPDPWTELILTEEWAKSFAAGVNEVPAPLFIPGHANDGLMSGKMRAIPDGYVVGGRVVGEKLYLRNVLPIAGTEDKKSLVEQTIREIKAKMLSTSSSDIMKVNIERDSDSYDVVYHAVESLKDRSNALVEADQTGSAAEIIVTSFKALEAGVADSNKSNEGEGSMPKEEFTLEAMFSSLKNRLSLGQVSLKEVEENLGFKVLTEERKADLKRLEDAEKILGNVNDFAKDYQESQKVTFTTLKEAALKEKFKEPELIETATELFSLKEGNKEQIEAEVVRIASFKIFEKILGSNASEFNTSFKTSGTDTDDESVKDIPEEMEG